MPLHFPKAIIGQAIFGNAFLGQAVLDSAVGFGRRGSIPIKALDQGDGTFALGLAPVTTTGSFVSIKLGGLPIRAYAIGDGTYALDVTLR